MGGQVFFNFEPQMLLPRVIPHCATLMAFRQAEFAASCSAWVATESAKPAVKADAAEHVRVRETKPGELGDVISGL
ncbi:hypothetical protein CA13_18960 [Planctomycetes bacterium CA13]|uniref:Uncharacterized protein n=2 Tax=Novipirellula herctigrandis TaxID=2527986 RepID=A0A5C5Z0V0_9BACT|nr:hypothetical protein CA13_18960 [Planctomycetes bacterium CA13]